MHACRPACHHLCGAAVRQRRGDGGRPPCHGGQPDLPSFDGQGGPGRPPQRRRHRRRGRPGDGDDPAVPTPARALREGRRHHAQPRGQGEPAVDDGAGQPPRGHAGHGRRADLRRLRPAARLRAAVGLTTPPAAGTKSATTWPPGRAACMPAPSSRSAAASTLDRDGAADLACRALWEAADADSATGGPDALRGIYPIVASIDVDGWRRLDDEDLARRFAAIVEEVRAR